MRRISCLILPLLALSLGGPLLAEDSDKAALCAEAEQRYVDLFGAPSSAADGVTVVTMYKYNFCPAEITVPRGTTVRWVNVDKRTSHSVLAPDASMPESDRAFPEEHVEFTFLESGTSQTLCGPHWETQQMIGMVTITD